MRELAWLVPLVCLTLVSQSWWYANMIGRYQYVAFVTIGTVLGSVLCMIAYSASQKYVKFEPWKRIVFLGCYFVVCGSILGLHYAFWVIPYHPTN